MFGVLTHPLYRRLFAAQVSALLGTGLLTVALGLLAFELAGERAGAVLGTALAIKMVAYVGLSPIANALGETLPRRAVLVGADLVRAAVAITLPFIQAEWQIYVAIFVLQAASATFTPSFQAVIPDILTDEAEYTKALSLSRLAYELENLLSPVLALALLAFVSFSWLFVGTCAGFLLSAFWVVTTPLPARASQAGERSFFDRMTRGSRIYLATPRLRGLLGFNMVVAAIGAFVFVNTVVIVRGPYGGSDADVAIALAAFGAGAMAAALALPALLARFSDRTLMGVAAAIISLLALAHGAAMAITDVAWPTYLAIYVIYGAGYSTIITPAGRLITQSSSDDSRASVFTAQFALSHACFLITYPLAGWIGSAVNLYAALFTLGAIALSATGLSLRAWPANDPEEITHDHSELAADHPHVKAHQHKGRHQHRFVIDDVHPSWPK